MTLLEYGQRAFDHDGASFNGAPVQLTGFVVDGEAGGFRLARYQIACCAADATPVVVRVVGTRGDAPGARPVGDRDRLLPAGARATCRSSRPRASSRSERPKTRTSEHSLPARSL